MRNLKNIFRKKSYAGVAAPAIRQQPNADLEWLEPILDDVRSLEIPDADQLDYSFNGYLASLQKPIEELDAAMEEIVLQGREIVQRTLEIAPDFFEKSLKRYPLDTDHYIDGGKNE